MWFISFKGRKLLKRIGKKHIKWRQIPWALVIQHMCCWGTSQTWVSLSGCHWLAAWPELSRDANTHPGGPQLDAWSACQRQTCWLIWTQEPESENVSFSLSETFVPHLENWYIQKEPAWEWLQKNHLVYTHMHVHTCVHNPPRVWPKRFHYI